MIYNRCEIKYSTKEHVPGSFVMYLTSLRMEIQACFQRSSRKREWTCHEDIVIFQCMTKFLQEDGLNEPDCWNFIVIALKGSKTKRECQERWSDYLVQRQPSPLKKKPPTLHKNTSIL